MKIKRRFLIGLGMPVVVAPIAIGSACGSGSNLAAEQIGRTNAEIAAYQAELKEWKNDWSNYEWSEYAIVNTHVEEGVFQNQDLRNVVSKTGEHFWLPSFIDAIGMKAFEGADLPDSFNLHSTPAAFGSKAIKLLKIGSNAFSGCDLSGFKNFIPETVFQINDSAFNASKLPDDIKITQRVIDMGSAVFANTILPKGFDFNPKISYIPRDTFSNATFQAPFKLHSQFTSVNQGAFADVTFTGGKTNLDFSESRLQLISYGAFANAKFIGYEFKLPRTVTVLEQGALTRALFLDGFTFEDNSQLKYLPDQLFLDADLSNGINWNGVPIESMGSGTFQGSKLKNDFIIPLTIKSIGKEAFKDVDLSTSLNPTLISGLPKLVSLGDNSFQSTKLCPGFVAPKTNEKLKAENIAAALSNAVLPAGYRWSSLDKNGAPTPGAIVGL